ncbi:hypothetical protein [Streptomyces sp. Ag82_O1-12]|nr:hypothetical protein [Streptomyces sp. Ag82_O1-12]
MSREVTEVDNSSGEKRNVRCAETPLMLTRRHALCAAAAVAVSAGAGTALGQTARAADPDPAMSRWHVENEHVWNNEDYSEELQGITAGTYYWYLANNADDSTEGLWRMTPDFANRAPMIRNAKPDFHLGDIGFDFARHRLYAALEPAHV